jgi:hypothetical protein
MPEVADIEHLPVSQARAGVPAAWDTLFRRYQLPLPQHATRDFHHVPLRLAKPGRCKPAFISNGMEVKAKT